MTYVIAFCVLLLYLPPSTWLFYLAVMHVDRMQNVDDVKLHPVAVFTARYLLLPVGALHNAAHNTVFMTIVFWDWPRELTTTGRMNRYRNGPDGRRKRWAHAICAVLLDPFDRRGKHT